LAVFQLSIDGPTARLRLNRPEARNALPLGGWGALADAAEEGARSGAHLLILSGVPGGAFCAGADLGDFDSFRDDPGARAAFRLAIRSGLDRLRSLAIPTLALVEGACYGAGVAVAMACDIRFAGPAAQFAITPAKLGISYPQEDVHRLVSLVGAGHASRLLVSATAIDGAEAERIGLVERLIAGNIEEAAAQFAAAAAANGLQSLKTLKRGVLLAEGGIVSDADQDKVFDDLLGGETMFQRLAAHRDRRR
jgi:enoyl-CoA hydratase/carnithine racemase